MIKDCKTCKWWVLMRMPDKEDSERYTGKWMIQPSLFGCALGACFGDRYERRIDDDTV